MKNIIANTNIKGYLIGSGFDMMFKLPDWNSLTKSFSSFVIANADIARNDALAKIDIISEMGNAPSRQMQSIKNVADNHIKDKGLINSFMMKSLRLEHHNFDDKLFDEASKIFNGAEDLIVSTNVSDVFYRMGLLPAYKRADLSIGFYYPIHGNYFFSNENELAKPIMFESDYQNSSSYNKRLVNLSEMLQNIQEIHIFGYSMNDVKILSRIIEDSSTKVVYYYNFKDRYWREIIESQFKSLFGEDRISFICAKNNDEGYKENFSALLSSVKRQVSDVNLNELIEGLGD